MKSNSVKYLTLSAILVASLAAKAGVVFYTMGDSSDMESFDMVMNGQAISGLVGGIQISQPTQFGSPIDPTMPLNYVTVGLDLDGSLFQGLTYGYNSPASSLLGQQGIAPVWNNSALAIQNAAYLFYNYGNLSASGITGTVQQMAALQLAVFMALYDTTASGQVLANPQSQFYVVGGQDSGAITLAESWVVDLTGQYGYTESLLTPDMNFGDQGNPDGQLPEELMLGSSAVPEPGTILAGVLLLLPLGAGVARSWRKPAAE